MSRLLEWLKDPSQGAKFDVQYVAVPALVMPAQAVGGPRPLLRVSKELSSFPEWFQCFVWAHEVCHIKERHWLWVLATLVVCAPLLLVVLPYLERRADRAASKWLTVRQVVAATALLHRPGLKQRWLYGTPTQRARHAGCDV